MKRIPHRIIAAVSAIALSLPTVLSIYGGNDAYDINGDGSIDTKDLVRLMKDMAADSAHIDVNGDGSYDTYPAFPPAAAIAGRSLLPQCSERSGSLTRSRSC